MSEPKLPFVHICVPTKCETILKILVAGMISMTKFRKWKQGDLWRLGCVFSFCCCSKIWVEKFSYVQPASTVESGTGVV